MKGSSIKKRDASAAEFPGSDTLHPVLARIYAGRQIEHIEQTEYPLSRLVPPDKLKGIDTAVDLLQHAILHDERILVVGDFDVDGATSTTLAVKVLTALGAKHVDYLVPDRFKYGYGLTPEIVQVAKERNPQLIVTVDNGIASITGVQAAHELGIKVLITDHHLPGETLPQADAIVNPNQPGDTFPSKSLAGVGVIFYVMMALRTRLRDTGWFNKSGITEPVLSTWLDLVALGTVADMVSLDYNNRILVANGLARIQNSQCQPGILAILQLANRNPRQLSANDLGFVLAPRINAAGRLDDMSIGIECLLSASVAQASEFASRLESLNLERREMQGDMQQQATAAIAELNAQENSLPPGLCLYDERWHQGIVGLIASKMKERFNRPVIAFAQGDEGLLKGSARSVPGINIRDALDTIATTHPGLLLKFGGHAMAAGLTIELDRFDDFARAFASEIERLGYDGDQAEIIITDGELTRDELTIDVAQLLKDAGPWGQGFPEPLFEGRFEVIEHRVLKERHLKMLVDTGGMEPLDAIAFNSVESGNQPELSRIRATYRLDVNEFRGQRKAQLIIDYFQADQAD
ncbi:MAG: single-stranded-DNA-specific exonuclease RecJ [Acidiferrobacterales bacterium]